LTACEVEAELMTQNQNTWKQASFRSASWSTFTLHIAPALNYFTVLTQARVAKFRIR